MASLSELMAAAELADSDYRSAVVGAANARADYECDFHTSLVTAEGTSQAARERFAESECLDSRHKLLIAEAQEKAARTHVQVLLGLMVAQQSILKMDRSQDGGDW